MPEETPIHAWGFIGFGIVGATVAIFIPDHKNDESKICAGILGYGIGTIIYIGVTFISF